jgi:hypothetical protein
MGMVAAPVRLAISAAAAPADVDSLDVDVDFHDRKAKGALYRIPDCVRKVVGHLRDPGTILDDDVKGDGDPILADLNLDAPV